MRPLHSTPKEPDDQRRRGINNCIEFTTRVAMGGVKDIWECLNRFGLGRGRKEEGRLLGTQAAVNGKIDFLEFERGGFWLPREYVI